MNIRSLSNLLSQTDELTVIGKGAVVDGVICHVLGLVRSGRQLRLLVLQYDESFQQRVEEGEAAGLDGALVRSATNRMELAGRDRVESANPLQAVSVVGIGEREFAVHQSEHRRLHSQDCESVVILTEFLRHGWQPDGIDIQSIDMLFLCSLELDGDYAAIPTFGENPALRFSMRPASVACLVEQPITLTVGGSYPDRLWFRDAVTGEKHWAQINRVYLADMWVEMAKTFDDPRLHEKVTPEQIAQARSDFEERFIKICPRGMCFPIIEYECEEDISLQFYSRAYLDATPVHRSSAMGFIVSPDQPTGILGLKLKAAVIQEPFPANTISIEAELLQYHRTTIGSEIVIR